MKTNRFLAALIVAYILAAFAPALQARSIKGQLLDRVESAMEPGSTKVPAAGEVEFAFSPRAGAEALVVKFIHAEQHQLRVMGYAFTSPAVVQALIDVHKRAVNPVAVQVLVDYKENVTVDRSGKARAALGALVNAGIEVRTVDAYPIFHNKIILGTDSLQTGSFNYTMAAAKSNSENVIVLWHNPAAVQGYMKHWDHNWKLGTPWRPAY